MSLKCVLFGHNYDLAVDRSGINNSYHKRCKRCERPKPHTYYWAFWSARDWENDWEFLE